MLIFRQKKNRTNKQTDEIERKYWIKTKWKRQTVILLIIPCVSVLRFCFFFFLIFSLKIFSFFLKNFIWNIKLYSIYFHVYGAKQMVAIKQPVSTVYHSKFRWVLCFLFRLAVLKFFLKSIHYSKNGAFSIVICNLCQFAKKKPICWLFQYNNRSKITYTLYTFEYLVYSNGMVFHSF